MTEVFTSMGINFEAMSASVAAGDETWGDYAGTITAGLMAMEDELERNAAGVAIFGTKWEDVGGTVFMASGQAMEGIEGIGGATDAAAAQMATGIMPALERLKRTFITEFAPLGDKAGQVINKMIPFLEKAAAWLGEKVPKAIGWLEDKWEQYWPEAERTLVNFWYGIQPGLIWVRDMFHRFTAEYLPRLGEAWDILKRGWAEITSMYNAQLKPALQDLWEAPGLGQVETGGIASAFGAFEGILAGIYASGIIETIKLGIQGISWAAGLAKDAINWMKDALKDIDHWLRRVSDMFVWMKDRIWDAINAFNNLSLPSWLTPGSATPLELGLIGIGDAFAKLDKMPNVDWTAQAATGGGAATSGAVTSVHINFGRDSVRSDEDMRFIIDGVQRTLELQGLRARIN